MSYDLQALIGKRETLQSHVATFQHVQIVPLAQGVAMIPFTDDLFEEVGGDGERDHFYKYSPELELWMQRVSLESPIAYVEAEYFGGVGCQNSVVWVNGALAIGPVHAETAINQALKLLGVRAIDERDEFDALGLGKHRGTESWLQQSEG